ncbi:Multimeric flavodoxin WrbA [Peptoclostridium litorale DSM 5388]|uniref:NADPH-dependent FMN reductase n=1 Tax=Peptoclostridium litorale DSM 5388 TaxID=1121324 RepID=A0A069RGU9_PEPLI|nr:NAD(P)H-dependent oxidoreductase [Peptoclostridium litorale]KDR93973.1 NADPH-dependent FMN reductase [Peptoclostridium litorale DSM 5388]KDR95400.1 NADPH-dependent FMN reductase [Peptoclostridium litorale DSM 5388]SIN89610.1 Multimeric flavodoxin WrbA [Peptoclostridium litorale DSM 5388]
MNVYVVKSKESSEELSDMVDEFCKGNEKVIIESRDDIHDLKNKKVVFAAQLDGIGVDRFILDVLLELRKRGDDSMEGAMGAVLIHSNSELYTKSAMNHIVFTANLMGCSFMGHPGLEIISGYKNLMTWKKVYPDKSLHDINLLLSQGASRRFFKNELSKVKSPKMTVLHASSRKTSNTLMLWNYIEEEILKHDCEVNQIHIENSDMKDCRGCSFKMCKHYGEQTSCFYGGLVVDEVFPAVEESDCIVFICPNYNDSISANLMALINRLTALYRKMMFYDKTVFAVIVSGNSGSDSVARQLIGALNINKGFRLPSKFAIMELANDPGSIKSIKGIKEKAADFANHMLSEIKK